MIARQPPVRYVFHKPRGAGFDYPLLSKSLDVMELVTFLLSLVNSPFCWLGINVSYELWNPDLSKVMESDANSNDMNCQIMLKMSIVYVSFITRSSWREGGKQRDLFPEACYFHANTSSYE